MQLPLSGKTILNTREALQARKLSQMLEKLGGVVHEVPLLKISCKNSNENKVFLQRLREFDWIFFTSANGVHCFFSLLSDCKMDLPAIRIAVVGHKTEEALQQYGYQAELVPEVYDGENLVQEFLAKYEVHGKVLLVQGSRAREVISLGLNEAGIPYEAFVVYENTYNEEAQEPLKSLLSTKNFDFITFTSPSSVEAFMLFQDGVLSLQTNPIFVCIGKSTEDRARELGLTNTISPSVYTIEGMVQAMCETTK
jgi:uroporphyrinogen-III synthase